MTQVFILDGALRLKNAVQFLQELPLVVGARPKRWKVTIAEYHAQRSDEQNHALWGVAYPPIMEHVGLSGEADREELHEYFCGEFFGWVRYTILGKTKMRPVRTTTTDEKGKRDVIDGLMFGRFYNFVQRRAAEYGVVVPDPDPLLGQKAKGARV